jgi:hypothetical protein
MGKMISADKFEQFAFNHYRDALALVDAGSLDTPHINELESIGDRHVKDAVMLRLEEDDWDE